MTLDQINDWFDNFYQEFIEGRKPIRGRCWSGGNIELWDRDNIVIVLHIPFLRGKSDEDKATDMVKNIFDSEHQSISAELNLERFKKVVSGEEPLTEEDWMWPDE